jgi:hypothetical protein
MRFGPKGPRPPQRLGHFASLHSHAVVPAQFVGPKNATHFSIRAAKPSHTAGTLCEIKIEAIRRMRRIHAAHEEFIKFLLV